MDQIGSPSATKLTRLQWLLLVVILIVAALPRSVQLGYEAHFDELWHMELSTGRGSAHITLPMNVLIDRAPNVTSLAEAPAWYAIPSTLATVTHPPLYPMLLRGWRSLFGESIRVARAFSVVLSVLCVLTLFDAARQLHGPATALWACLIMALSATQIELAQQIRNYPLVSLMALSAAAALLRIERHGPSTPRMIALAAAVAAALLSHYFAGPAVVAMAIYAAWRLRGAVRLKTLGAIACAIVISAALWLPKVRGQAPAFAEASRSGPVANSDPHPIVAAIRRTAAVPMRALFEPRPLHSIVSLLSGMLFFIPLFLLRRRPVLLFWTIWLWCIVGAFLVLDLLRNTQHLEHVSHFILASPAVYALLAAMFTGARPLATHCLPALVATACLAAMPFMYWRDNSRFSEMGQHLSQATGDSPFVFYTDPEQRWWCHVMYLGASHYSGRFPRPVVRLDMPADDAMIGQFRRWNDVWLVWGATQLPPEQIVRGTRVVWYRPLPDIGHVAHLQWVEPESIKP